MEAITDTDSVAGGTLIPGVNVGGAFLDFAFAFSGIDEDRVEDDLMVFIAQFGDAVGNLVLNGRCERLAVNNPAGNGLGWRSIHHRVMVSTLGGNRNESVFERSYSGSR